MRPIRNGFLKRLGDFLVIAGISVSTLCGAVVRAEDQLSVAQDPIEVLLTLRASGFEPAEVLVPAQRFQLSVDNRTDIKELFLRLSTDNGTVVREMHIAGGGGDWSEVFDLSPGNYMLSEEKHNDWVCRLKVKS